MKLTIDLKFCADCERIWTDGVRCPDCGSKSFDFVSRYIPPMFWRGGCIDDSVKLRVKLDTVQKELQILQDDPCFHPPISLGSTTVGGLKYNPLKEDVAVRLGESNRKEAEPERKLSGLDYTGRVLGEAISRLLQIVNRANASPSAHMEAQVDKKRSLKSREEPNGRNRDTQAVSEAKPKLR